MSNEMFDISVITPVFNNIGFIERTIQSVLNQKGVKVQYIIVDGKSTDGTDRIVIKYENKIDVFVSEPDCGLYHAINKGLQYAKSGKIMILNSGDYYQDDFTLKTMVDCFVAEGGEKIIYGKMLVQNEDGTEPDLIELYRGKRKFMLRGCDVPHPTTLIPKKVYDLFGDYSLDFHIMADYDLLLRMHTKGVEFRGIDKTIVIFQRGGISSRFLKCLPQSYLVRKKNKVRLVTNLAFTLRSLLFFFINEMISISGFEKLKKNLRRFRRMLRL